MKRVFLIRNGKIQETGNYFEARPSHIQPFPTLMPLVLLMSRSAECFLIKNMQTLGPDESSATENKIK